MKWYADNSELHGIKDAGIPDILLFGGLIVSHADEVCLRQKVEEIKRKYSGYSRAPFKWNMKDLKSIYSANKMEAIYGSLIENSWEWRKDVFSCLAEIDCSILISCIEGYSSDRDVIKNKKEELSRFIFSNALMRFALHVSEAKPTHAQVILDWPEKANAKPFDVEYASAFSYGQTHDKSVKYSSGRLCDLGFSDSVLFASMHHSTLLQVADLIVGATREFIECCLSKKEAGIGVECLRLVKQNFRGAPEKIVGRGIVIPTGNNDLLMRVKKGVSEIINVT